MGSTRTLTIVFTDLVGSTEMLVGLGDSGGERIRRAHFGDVSEVVARFRGTVVKTLGDGVMAIFDAAEDALDAAVSIQQATSHGASVDGRTLSVRVGVSTGDVHLDGEDSHGIAVVEASRLCSAAAGSQILVSPATRLAARGGEVALEPHGTLELKGISEPVEPWLLPWSADEAKRLRVLLADDAALVREGLSRVLEQAGIEVVGQAADGDEAVALAAELKPHVAILDVRMPPTNTFEGIEAAERMRQNDPGLGILVLSQEVDSHSARRLLEIGPERLGYLLKERVTEVREFVAAVRRIAVGETAFEEDVIASLLGGEPGGSGIRELTPAEHEAVAALRRIRG